MIDIINQKTGDQFSYEESNQRLFKNGQYLSRTVAEPVYTGNNELGEPIFAGIYFPGSDELITLNGKTKRIVNQNTIK